MIKEFIKIRANPNKYKAKPKICPFICWSVAREMKKKRKNYNTENFSSKCKPVVGRSQFPFENPDLIKYVAKAGQIEAANSPFVIKMISLRTFSGGGYFGFVFCNHFS